ncbi:MULTISPECIES: LCP family protein [Streptomyces]|uniref:LytR family transcriptional regulator n=1 Tax=Streptomyces lycii TaxID=2654337 RepID=A0ABQ7FGD4_9ACTN|nr:MULTISPECIES: LytR C-terminal domain-containing protein [Streptomyces]KAF4407023.1 LytR family transcriptional regulator [Streptomyces lycii]PGH50423.1 hypothetical protein CRI70_12170 [Streptomyces sp. Ru87]
MNDAHSGRYGRPEDGQDPYVPDAYTQQYYDPYTEREQQPQQYDEYGRPYESYDPYTQQQRPRYDEQYDQYNRGYPQQQYDQGYAPQDYGHDPDPGGYGTGTGTAQPYPQQQPYPHEQQPQQPDPSRYPSHQQDPSRDPRHGVPQQSAQQQWAPQQQTRAPERPQQPGQPGHPGHPGSVPGPRDDDSGAPDYRTEQFSFIEEPDEDADDVIDWLKFAETRTERRDERKRKYRNRLVSLLVVLALALAGGVGYLWYEGKLPGLSGDGGGAQAAGGPQKRDVIIVHLRDTKQDGGSSTALLVNNETTGKGTTLLLPNSLAVTGESGSTTLGASVEEEGNGPTRDALNTLLGSGMKHSWRLDTPYLENLVELVGGITLDTDAAVPAAKKGEDPLVGKGREQSLDGRAAVGYATLLQKGEDQADQLRRFGQVLQAVLRKMPSDPELATTTVQTLNQIADPSLTEGQLGASLAELAEQAKSGAYETTLLPVRQDGTLSDGTAESVVKDVLGGTVTNADPDAAPRVSVRNATGDTKAAGTAQAALVNGGWTYVDGGTGTAQQTSRVTYADAARAAEAKEIATALGLPESAARKGEGAANADITVVLGGDYEPGGAGQ